MTLTERHRAFHRGAMTEGYPAGAIALYNVVLYLYEREYEPEGLRMSERDLARYSGQSNASVHRNLGFLVEHKYLKVEACKRGCVITLSEAPTKHERSIGVAPREIPINTRAHALPPPPTPSKPPISPFDEFEPLLTFWRSSELMPRLFPHQEAILRKYSAAEVKEALHAAMDANRPDKDGNSGLCFAFIESFLPGSVKHKRKRKPKSAQASEPKQEAKAIEPKQEAKAILTQGEPVATAAKANKSKEGISNGMDGLMASSLSRKRRQTLFGGMESEIVGANASGSVEPVRAGCMRPIWA